MANDCLFTMRVRSRSVADLKEFLERVESKSYRKSWLSRIFDFYAEDTKIENGYFVCSAWGSCAWSVWSCMFEGESTYYSCANGENKKSKRTTINRLCKRFKVECEIFSEEYGVGFQEHYFINEKGEILINDCKDAFEKENNNEEYEIIGGFDNYLEFSF